MRYFIAVLILWGVMNTPLNAQQPRQGGGGNGAPGVLFQVTGKIQDAGTKLTLEYATVSMFSANDSSLATGNITDEKGNFVLEVKKPGQYYLVASFLGYIEQNIGTVTLKPDEPKINLGIILLKPDSESIGEVEIVAERSQMQMQLDKKVFTVGKDLANAGGTAVDVLDNIPSVQVDVDGNVSLRGSGNVQIFIDGKPSGLSGPDALKFLQSDQIDRVEVVTNPSARYSAEGEVGIINIILKKDRKQGLNGSVSATTGYPNNHGGSLTLNYRTKHVNLFTSYNLNYRENIGNGYYRQEFTGNDTLAILEADRDHNRGGLGSTFRLGSDFFWKDNNTITIASLYSYRRNTNVTNLSYQNFNSLDELISSSNREEDEFEISNNFEAELNYRRSFKKKGQEFTAVAKWFTNNDNEEGDILEKITLGNAANVTQRTGNKELETNWLLQTDYIHPLPKGMQFETGARITLRSIDNNYFVDQLENAEWNYLPGFVDTFSYQENIYAAYAILSGKYKKISWQGGLRTEVTDIDITSAVNNTEVKKNYVGFFPSAHFSYAFNENNTFQISYSRRLSRPQFRDLLPFSNYSDSRNFRAGNPDLDPEYTNSFELGYLRYWKTGSLLSSVYYRYRTGVTVRITQVNDEGLAINFPVNLSEEHSVGVEFTISQTLWKIWTLTGGANAYFFESKGSYLGQDLGASSLAGNMRLTSKWALPKDFAIQAAMTYRSPQQRAQGRSLSITALDISASKDLFKKKATLSLNVRDVFNSRKFRSETTTSEFTRYDEFQWATRQVVLTFSYRFGTQTKQQKRNSGGGDGGGGMDEY
jgi:outer membrane receptor protein involved in Fe transport